MMVNLKKKAHFNMTAPFFFIDNIHHSDTTFLLNEETSKHVVMVLRMNQGESIHLTDGKGSLLTGVIIDANKKKCVIKKISIDTIPFEHRKISVAISPIKNTHRFEWFLEKVTEIGVCEIIPTLCERTEKQHLKMDRLKSIIISAMLQSKQCWLPLLHEPIPLKKVLSLTGFSKKLIAHCEKDEQKKIISNLDDVNNSIILIGPEGDFTPQEIDWARTNHFIPVSLGKTRLRTETAGIVAITLMNQP